ncbi:MAG TPA: hypothetical protein VIB39_15855 [Candidatus Angelobacter sp.]|jgi:hypothetical protein
MAVHKAKRSNSSTQLHPSRRAANNPQTGPLPTPQILDLLQNLNRGYGTALINLDNLQLINTANRTRIISIDRLRNIRRQTDQLRALANRELLVVLSNARHQ